MLLRRNAFSSFVFKIVLSRTPSLLPSAERYCEVEEEVCRSVTSGSCVFEFYSLGKCSIIISMRPAQHPTNEQTSLSPLAKRRRASPSREVELPKSITSRRQRVALYCALVRRLHPFSKCYTGNTAVQSRTKVPQRTTYPVTSLPGILRTWVLANAYSQCLTYHRTAPRNCKESRRLAICVIDAAYDVDRALRTPSNSAKTAMTLPWIAPTNVPRGEDATSLVRMEHLPTFSLHSSKVFPYVLQSGFCSLYLLATAHFSEHKGRRS